MNEYAPPPPTPIIASRYGPVKVGVQKHIEYHSVPETCMNGQYGIRDMKAMSYFLFFS